MEIQFAETFTKSLKRLRWHSHWIYQIYSIIRYDLPRFIKNIYKFRNVLWSTYWFDHHGLLLFMETHLSDMANRIEKDGYEIDVSRLKKVAAMKRAVELINNYIKDRYIEMAEKELGELIKYPWEFEEIEDCPGMSKLIDNETEEEKEHNGQIYTLSNEIANREWIELWDLVKGQNINEYHDIYELLTDEEKKENEIWYTWFNGTDMRGWWD